MFFSLDRLVTGNQILNNKCQRQFLLLFQFERRSFQAVLFSFQIVTTTKTMAEIWYVVDVLFSSKLFPLISAGPQKSQKLTTSKIKYEKFRQENLIPR